MAIIDNMRMSGLSAVFWPDACERQHSYMTLLKKVIYRFLGHIVFKTTCKTTCMHDNVQRV